MRPPACTDSQRAFSIVCPVGPLVSARATVSATVAVLLLAVMFALGGRSAAASTSEPLTFPTDRGPLVVTTLGHASLMFQWNGEVIYADPVSAQADYTQLPDADQIWITHDHGDHLDPKAIAQIRTGATQIVADTHSAAKLGAGVIALRNGEKTTLGGIAIAAVPAYNLVRGPSAAQKYHPKGWYNGYIADFGGFRVYIAGDTEKIPEMADFGPIDLAFVPINLPYTMPPAEAAEAIKLIAPKHVVPYHQGNSDPAEVQRLLAGTGIDVIVRSLP